MKKGIKTKFGKKDIKRINTAFYNKVEEYSKLSLDELKELYPSLGGSYREACLSVVQQKLQEEKKLKLQEAIDDVKSNITDAEIIEETVETNKPETNE